MRALLLHNPTAGDGHVSAEDLYRWLRKAGLAPEYCSSKEDAYRDALGEGLDLLIVAGGDGTVGKVVRNLADRAIQVAVLPTGTANNIARSLGLDGNLEGIAAAICDGHSRRLDIGRASGPWGDRRFVEGVGLGAVAKTILRGGPERPKAEKVKAGRETFRRVLADTKPVQVELDIDGERIEGAFPLVEVLNLPFSGPALPIALDAAPDDRLLDIVFLPEEKREEMIDWLQGEPEGSPPPVTTRKGRDIGLHWSGSPLRIDDKIFCEDEKSGEAKIEIEAEALSVCVPQDISKDDGP
jgi:diacylglycerol kinase (ATP)